VENGRARTEGEGFFEEVGVRAGGLRRNRALPELDGQAREEVLVPVGGSGHGCGPLSEFQSEVARRRASRVRFFFGGGKAPRIPSGRGAGLSGRRRSYFGIEPTRSRRAPQPLL